ncbi:hypothetical protein [Variovorax sp. PAMC 28711]|uniref:hypothetical protein n=1 Tax=Variovorax sp. PAMC 28711 TaxID=1795631 RepID=UPI000AA2DC04|nr:hypothetical protein [Variovorax sp. PAMC 28711]
MNGKRGAPVVAALNKASARSNIEAKIHAIESVLRLSPSSLKALSLLPRSLRQFNLWEAKRGSLFNGPDDSAIPIVDLTRNARQTLVANQVLVDRTSAVLAVIGTATNGRRLGGKRAANLEARLSFLENLRAAAEAALSNAHEKINGLQIALKRERIKVRQLVEKSNKEMNLRADELEEERSKVAELTRQLRDISKFRKV